MWREPIRTWKTNLGGLSLTLEGLMERDRLVILTALMHGIPVAIVLAGGYAQKRGRHDHDPRQHRGDR